MSMIVDLPAVGIFLLVECLLFLPGDVAMILGRHATLFMSDLVVVTLEAIAFCLAHFAIGDLVVNATILIVEAAIDLCAAGMVFVPLARGLCERMGGQAKDGAHCDKQDFDFHGNRFWILVI
jgi:hypothetical protein